MPLYIGQLSLVVCVFRAIGAGMDGAQPANNAREGHLNLSFAHIRVELTSQAKKNFPTDQRV